MSSSYDLAVINHSSSGFPKNEQSFEISVSYQCSDLSLGLRFFMNVSFIMSKTGKAIFLFIFHLTLFLTYIIH